MARDQNQGADDPARLRAHHPDDTICSRCDSVVRRQRWVIDPGHRALLRAGGAAREVICPACARAAGGQIRGTVILAGDYWPVHLEDLLNLVRHQEQEAASDNPLQRILDIREEADCLVIETTDGKLAQKIGRSIQKAHAGDVDVRWLDREHSARVTWTRSASA